MQSWILIVIVLVVVILAVALFVAFLRDKSMKNRLKEKEVKIPNAQEILELLKDKKNDLNKLEQYSNLAYIHYKQYMEEMPDFDLDFVAILTSHKGVNAKLILEVERNFKQANPARKELLEKALNMGLEHR